MSINNRENGGSCRIFSRFVLLMPICSLGFSGCTSVDQVRMSVFLGEERLDRSMNYYARGREHFLAGRHGLAIQAFHMSLMKDGDDPDTLNALGASYDGIRRFGLAKKYYVRALTQRKDSPVILNNIGYSLLLQGKPDQAVQYLRRARDLGPDQPLIDANLKTAMRAAKPAIMADANSGSALDKRELAASILSMPKVWLQRTSKAVRTLITRPNKRFLARAAAKGVNPRLVMHMRETGESRSLPYASTPSSIVTTKVERITPYANGMTAAPILTVVESPSQATNLPPMASTGIPARKPKIEVSNGAGRHRMARRLKRHLTPRGWAISALSNASHFHYRKTIIFVRPDFQAEGQALSKTLPNGVEVRTAWSSQKVDILIRLGGDLLDFDKELSRSTRDA